MAVSISERALTVSILYQEWNKLAKAATECNKESQVLHAKFMKDLQQNSKKHEEILSKMTALEDTIANLTIK